MALTQIQQVRLEIGDSDPVFQILSDEEVQYFLDKNNQSVRKTSLDCAKSILFRIASLTFERVDVIEYRGNDYFNQYKQALQMYIKNPEYGAVSQAMGYAGGISLSDIEQNISNFDNNTVKVDKSIPIGGYAHNVNNTSPFSVENLPRKDEFSI